MAASWTIGSEEDGPDHQALPNTVQILPPLPVWPGVRRAGLPRLSPPLTPGQRRAMARRLDRRFETRCARAGVRLITVHDTRHTCATLLAALDVHPRVAMRVLRHAQIDVTMNVYTEVSDAKTLQALRRLGKQLGS